MTSRAARQSRCVLQRMSDDVTHPRGKTDDPFVIQDRASCLDLGPVAGVEFFRTLEQQVTSGFVHTPMDSCRQGIPGRYR